MGIVHYYGGLVMSITADVEKAVREILQDAREKRHLSDMNRGMLNEQCNIGEISYKRVVQLKHEYGLK